MGKRTPKKIVLLDCNWYVSASINKSSRRTLFEIVTNPKFEVIYADELISEFKEVIERDKFRKIIRPPQVNRFIKFIKPLLVRVKIRTNIRTSRDPKDHYLINLAFDAHADYLVTGDKDLPILKNIGRTRILKMSEFIELNIP